MLSERAILTLLRLGLALWIGWWLGIALKILGF